MMADHSSSEPKQDVVLCRLPLRLYKAFDLEKAVCNHGFFMMAPNKWNPATKTLTRPLRLADKSCSAVVHVRQLLRGTANAHLQVLCAAADHQHLASPLNRRAIEDQVKRMLRLSGQDEVHSLIFQDMHPGAQARGFGRLFRSPTLFEDIIKSVLLCNCGWRRSLEMAQALCNLQYEICSNSGETLDDEKKANGIGDFPNSKELEMLGAYFLKVHCNLGYRGKIIYRIAGAVNHGRLKLGNELSSDELEDALLKIRGVKEFVVANVSMCVGLYTKLPIDTEAIRHVHKVHGVKEKDDSAIVKRYKKYAPYDCLAYWFEHVEYYESKLGKLSELGEAKYWMVTSSSLDEEKSNNDKQQVTRKKKKKRSYRRRRMHPYLKIRK